MNRAIKEKRPVSEQQRAAQLKLLKELRRNTDVADMASFLEQKWSIDNNKTKVNHEIP